MDTKQRLFEFIEANRDRMIELEKLLTSIPAISPASGGTGEAEKAKALAGWLEANGFTGIEDYPADDPAVPGGKRPNLAVSVPGTDSEKKFWIMSHLDVVPPGESALWHENPYTVVVKDGKLYGRGVEDNQQGLVSSVFAALAFLKTGIKPKRTLSLLFVADEEMGSDHGIKFLLREHNLFGPDDIFLVPDGGRPDGTMIEVAEKSLLWLKFLTSGSQVHASRPDQGRNAFLAASDLVVRLGTLGETYPQRNPIFEPPYSTFSPTKKEANVPNVNTIPGEDVFYLDCRILPSVNVDDVLATVRRHMDEVEQRYGVEIRYEIVQRVESKPTPESAPIVTSLAKAVKEVYGTDAEPVGIGGGTVGAYLRNAGHDTVVWSKMDETAHMPNEYAILDNIVGDAKVMALLAIGE